MSTHNMFLSRYKKNYLPDTHSYLDLWDIHGKEFKCQNIRIKMSQGMTKPTKLYLCPAKTQISLGIFSV